MATIGRQMCLEVRSRNTTPVRRRLSERRAAERQDTRATAGRVGFVRHSSKRHLRNDEERTGPTGGAELIRQLGATHGGVAHVR